MSFLQIQRYNYYIQEGQRQLKIKMFKKYNNINHKRQIKYSNTYQEYFKLANTVELLKANLRYSMKAKVNSFDADFNFTFIEKNYDLKQKINHFISNDSNYKLLQSLEASIKSYLLSDDIKGYSSYQYIELKMKEYELQRKKLKSKIKAYVKSAIHSYSRVSKKKNSAYIDLLNKEEYCRFVQAKLDSKKATKLELYQANVEKALAEITYYQICYDIITWENILDNNIYGTSS